MLYVVYLSWFYFGFKKATLWKNENNQYNDQAKKDNYHLMLFYNCSNFLIQHFLFEK